MSYAIQRTRDGAYLLSYFGYAITRDPHDAHCYALRLEAERHLERIPEEIGAFRIATLPDERQLLSQPQPRAA